MKWALKQWATIHSIWANPPQLCDPSLSDLDCIKIMLIFRDLTNILNSTQLQKLFCLFQVFVSPSAGAVSLQKLHSCTFGSSHLCSGEYKVPKVCLVMWWRITLIRASWSIQGYKWKSLAVESLNHVISWIWNFEFTGYNSNINVPPWYC